MPPKSLQALLYTLGALLSVGSFALRVNHWISLSSCVALLTIGLVLTSKARKIRKTHPA